MEAKRVRKDTRIKAGKSRLEKFTFPITPGTKVRVTVKLVYIATHGDHYPDERMEMFSIEKESE
jgi:hypothetical protein